MHVVKLLEYLEAQCGKPIQIEGQDAYRWDVRPAEGGSCVHLCLTLERDTRRASIWVFDPDKPSESQTEYLEVSDEHALAPAIERIAELCPFLAPVK